MSQMMFHYRVIDRSGSASRGVLRAPDERDAYRQLVAAGMKPIKLRAARPSFLRRRRHRINLKDIAHFTYQFAVMTKARISLVDGLRSIAEQEPNDRLRDVIQDIARSVEGGATVTESISPHRNIFGEVYVEMIRAAESSGNMNEVLASLSDMLERQYEINRMVRSALLYPLCVICTLVAAVTFLMIFVVPRFASMFASRGLELPLPTQIVVGISDGVRSHWWLIGLVVVAVFFGLRKAWQDREKRRRLDALLHRVPVLGEILRGLAVSRFAHIFGVALRSGLPLTDVIEMSGKASGRPLLEQDAEKMKVQVNEGGRLADVLITCTYLPPFTRRMLSCGEESAEMSQMCQLVARHYDREVGDLTKNITTLIEPIMVIGLAAVVLLIALAIFLPLWDMASLIG
ncbi:MAG: type II secretion system F family protein [Phycisphaerales bacterium]|nr:MAG: type II secretion system F family protein [Phycisphaerales bacterium]